MRDLFTCVLGEVTTEDVVTFLRMNAPLNERPAESTRIDYKADVPDEFGDYVCAFANTFGGLIFLGVKAQGIRPSEVIGVPKARGDLTTRLVNTIQTTVHPRPPFEIHVVGAPGDPAGEIAIVRVGEGDWPPYMYIKERANRVTVRVEEQRARASYSELEALFRRRSEGAQNTIDRPLSGPEFHPFRKVGNEWERADNFERLVFRPARPLHLMLDRREGRLIAGELANRYPSTEIAVVRRDSQTLDFQITRPNGSVRIWRAWEDGSQGVTSDTHGATNQGRRVVSLFDVSYEWIVAARVTRCLLEQHGWAGRVLVDSVLRLSNATPSVTTLDGVFGLDGLWELEKTSPQKDASAFVRVVDFSELTDPSDLVADLLIRHVLDQRGSPAMADHTALKNALAELVSHDSR